MKSVPPSPRPILVLGSASVSEVPTETMHCLLKITKFASSGLVQWEFFIVLHVQINLHQLITRLILLVRHDVQTYFDVQDGRPERVEQKSTFARSKESPRKASD